MTRSDGAPISTVTRGTLSWAALLSALAAASCSRDKPSDAERVGKATTDPVGYAQDVEHECAGGHAKACTSLGVHYAFGTFGRKVDYAKARELFERSCDGDPAGCHELAVLYEHGRGVAVDRTRARSLYERACAAGSKASCGK